MTAVSTAARKGLTIDRTFSEAGVSPFDRVEWETRTAEIKEGDRVVFRQEGVEFPKAWSQTATNVVASKYFWGREGTPERESSVRQLVSRVVDHIAASGMAAGYFASGADGEAFRDELAWLCLNQHAAFNSPVWFNVGVNPRPTGYAWLPDAGAAARCDELTLPRYQVSACFILAAEDDIPSISRRAAIEMNIFRDGSGAGSDNSRIRSSRERIRGGGRASGPVSFMRVYDSVAAVTKSGGRSRRAAKMEILRCDHPDIREFIDCKPAEERKARALIGAGYGPSFNGEAYNTVLFQNANLSVRATDAFLRAAEAGGRWQTLSVITGNPVAADGTLMPEYNASDLLDGIAEGTWVCGDPGLQYDDALQRWHTCPNAGPIRASNPCSEYVHLDDSACNLASINLMKFRREDGSFDIPRFLAAVRLLIVAQDILCERGAYPTPEIAETASKYRQLGLGYCGLGALLMASGLPYDSDEGRALAAAVTAVMQGQAYLTSAEVAGVLGPFAGFAADREATCRVLSMHHAAAVDLFESLDRGGAVGEDGLIRRECVAAWRLARVGLDLCHEASEACRAGGVRNSQVSVLAPTGTIAFMMDSGHSTGIEPAIGLVQYKTLAGGGLLKIVNPVVPLALGAMGVHPELVDDAVAHLERTDSLSGWLAEHAQLSGVAPVFDCAFPDPASGRSIHWTGHVKMMAAVQPFLSGAISKTVNMPADSTVADIRAAYLLGWKLGLKALAIYRDGSKGSQPVTTKKAEDAPRAEASPSGIPDVPPARRRLPDTRAAVNHKAMIAGHEAYITVGLYPDGAPGELFVTVAKEGSTVSGLLDAWATSVSMMLQYGVSADVIVGKFVGGRFDPSGLTRNPDIPIASSPIDYIARWLGMQFVPGYREENAPRRGPAEPGPSGIPDGPPPAKDFRGVVCDRCGNVCVPTGRCWTCSACGSSNGGCG